MLEVLALFNHQISFALLQMLAWSTGVTCSLGGQSHLSIYSQSQDIYKADTDFSEEDAYSQHSQHMLAG